MRCADLNDEIVKKADAMVEKVLNSVASDLRKVHSKHPRVHFTCLRAHSDRSALTPPGTVAAG